MDIVKGCKQAGCSQHHRSHDKAKSKTPEQIAITVCPNESWQIVPDLPESGDDQREELIRRRSSNCPGQRQNQQRRRDKQ